VDDHTDDVTDTGYRYNGHADDGGSVHGGAGGVAGVMDNNGYHQQDKVYIGYCLTISMPRYI